MPSEPIDDPTESRPTDEELLAVCDVETFRASGPGGQHVNRRETAVRLRHRPSGIVVICQDTRSQLENKRIAAARLRERLEIRFRPRRTRLKTGIPRVARAARRAFKIHRSRKKANRRPPDSYA